MAIGLRKAPIRASNWIGVKSESSRLHALRSSETSAISSSLGSGETAQVGV